jgi:hypothetical protein
MTTPEFVIDVMREQDLRYYLIQDSEYRTMYQQWQPISLEESVARFERFIKNCSTNSIFRINLFGTNERLKDGTPKRDGLTYEVMITESLRDKKQEQPQYQQAGMNGFDGYVDKAYNAGSMGAIDLDRYLSSKDEILKLQLRIQQLEMENRYLTDRNTRDLESLRKEYEAKNSKEEKIMGIAGQFFPMIMGGGGQSPMNGITEEPETMEKISSTKEKVINAVNELMAHDPNFVKNIQALSKLCKESPAIYKIAVEKLNSL